MTVTFQKFFSKTAFLAAATMTTLSLWAEVTIDPETGLPIDESYENQLSKGAAPGVVIMAGDTILTYTGTGNSGTWSAEGYDIKIVTPAFGSQMTLNNPVTANSVWFSSGRWQLNATGRLANAGTIYVAGGQLWFSNANETFSNNIVLGTSTYTESNAYGGAAIRLDRETTFSGNTNIVSDIKITSNDVGKLTLADLTGTGNLTLETYNTTTSKGLILQGTQEGSIYTGTINIIQKFSVTKSGTGKQIVGGISGVGNVTVDAGTLQIGNGGEATGLTTTGTVSISDGAILAFNHSNNIVRQGIISGAGSLTKSGTGTLTLSGANIYSGGTTISAGRLIATNASALGTGSLALTSGELELTTGITGLTGNVDLNGGILILSGLSDGTTALTTTGTATVAADNVKINVEGLNIGTYTIASNLSVSGTLATDDFTTSTRQSVSVNENNTFSIEKIVYSLNWTGGDGVWDKTVSNTPWTIDGGNTPSEFANDDSVAFNILNDTSVTISENVTPASTTVNVDSDKTLTFTGTGGIVGSGTLTKSGSGTLVISNTNTFTGGTTIDDGTISTSALGALGSGSVTFNGGTLSLVSNLNIGTLSGQSGSLNLNERTITITQANDGTFAGIISGSGSLSKSGSGTLTLLGANTYTGTTTISSGTLQAENASALGTGAVSISSGALLVFNHLEGVATIASVSGSGAIVKNNAGTLVLSGALALGGSITINDGIFNLNTSAQKAFSGSLSINGGEVNVSTTDSLNYGGTASVTLNGGVLDMKTARWTIGANNKFILNGGSIIGTGDANAALDFIGNNTIDVRASSSLSAKVRLRDNKELAFSFSDGAILVVDNGLAGTGSLKTMAAIGSVDYTGVLKIIGNAGTLTGNLTVGAGTTVQIGDNGTSGSIVPNSFVIEDNSKLRFAHTEGTTYTINKVISGAGELEVLGTTLTLSGTNTYSGGTTISAGRLIATNASALGTGSLTLTSGELELTTGITGLTGNVDLNGGTLILSGLSDGTTALTTTGTATLAADNVKINVEGLNTGTYTIVSNLTLSSGTLSVENDFIKKTRQAVTLSEAQNTFSIEKIVYSLNWTGGDGVWDKTVSNTPWTIDGGNTPSEFANDDSVAFNILNDTLVTISENVTPASTTVNVDSDKTLTFTGTGGIVGSGTLTKSGSGTLVISNTNTFTGGTTIDDGTIVLSTNGVLQTNNSIIVNQNAILQLGSEASVLGNGTVTRAATGTGKVVLYLTGNLTDSGGGNASVTRVDGLSGFGGTIEVRRGLLRLENGSSGLLDSVSGANKILLNGGGLVFLNINSGTDTTKIFNKNIEVATAGEGVIRIYANGHTKLSGEISGAGTLRKTDGGEVIYTGIVNNLGAYINAQGSTTFNGEVVNIGNYTNKAGTTTFNANTTLSSLINESGTVKIESGKTLTFNVLETLSLQGVISGAGSVAKTGSGTLTINNGTVNTFSGGFIIREGVVDILSSLLGDNSVMGATTNTITVGQGGTLKFTGNRAAGYHKGSVNITGGTITMNGNDITFAATNTVSFDVTAGTIDGSGLWRRRGEGNNIIVTAAATGSVISVASFEIREANAGVLVEEGAILTISSAVKSSGNYGFVKEGAGTLVLTGTNVYQGATTINAGTIQIGDGGMRGSLGSGAVSIADGAALSFNRSNGLTATNAISLNGNSKILVTEGTTVSLSGVISGSGSLEKNNNGTLVLSGSSANTYSGGTTISAGMLVAEKRTALGTGTVTLNGGTLDVGLGITGVSNVVLTEGTVVLSGLAPGGVGFTTINNGTTSFTENVFFDVKGLANGTYKIASLLDGSLTAASAAWKTTARQEISYTEVANEFHITSEKWNLIWNGQESTTWDFSGANWTKENDSTIGDVTFANGDTVIFNSTETMTINISDNMTPLSSIMNVDEGKTLTFAGTGGILGNSSVIKEGLGTLKISNANTYTGGTTVNTGTIIVNSANALGTGEINLKENTKLVFENDNFDITFSQVISGAGSIENMGSGTLIIDNANTYTGGTTINEGVLTVANNSALGSGNVTIGNGAALQISDGIVLSNISTITLNETAKLIVDLSAYENTTEAFSIDLLVATQFAVGSTTLTSQGKNNVTEAMVGRYELINGQDWSNWRASWAFDDGTLKLQMVIPEPSFFGLIAGLAALSLIGGRRRRK